MVRDGASTATRVYGGLTGEERVAERRGKLIEAGMVLFGSGGSVQVRVKDIVVEAGLTERYFYESFSDLGDLFDAVFEDAAEVLESKVKAADPETSGDTLARVAIVLRTTVNTLTADPRMIRIFFVEALGKGGRPASRHGHILNRATGHVLQWPSPEDRLLLEAPAEDQMKAFALSGAASELLVAWAEGVLEVTPSELSDFLVGLYRRSNLP